VPPTYMCEKGRSAHQFFEKRPGSGYSLKSMETYMQVREGGEAKGGEWEQSTVEHPSKRYFNGTSIPEIVNSYPITRKTAPKDLEKEMQNRQAFIHFLQGLLNLNPFERWSPQQAKLHPFITGEKFTGSFTPPGRGTGAKTAPGAADTSSSSSPPKPSSLRPRATTVSTSNLEDIPPSLAQVAALQQQQGAERAKAVLQPSETTSATPVRPDTGSAPQPVLQQRPSEQHQRASEDAALASGPSSRSESTAGDTRYVTATQSAASSAASDRSFVTAARYHDPAGRLGSPGAAAVSTPDGSPRGRGSSGGASPVVGNTRPDAFARAHLTPPRGSPHLAAPDDGSAFQRRASVQGYPSEFGSSDPPVGGVYPSPGEVYAQYPHGTFPRAGATAALAPQHQPTGLAPQHPTFPLRKARSQTINYGVIGGGGGTPSYPAQGGAAGAGFLPLGLLASPSTGASPEMGDLPTIRLARSNSLVPPVEGHPRHGETGERRGMPSRRPSVTATGSSEWDPFEDMEQGMGGGRSGSAGGSSGYSSRRASVGPTMRSADGGSAAQWRGGTDSPGVGATAVVAAAGLLDPGGGIPSAAFYARRMSMPMSIPAGQMHVHYRTSGLGAGDGYPYEARDDGGAGYGGGSEDPAPPIPPRMESLAGPLPLTPTHLLPDAGRRSSADAATLGHIYVQQQQQQQPAHLYPHHHRYTSPPQPPPQHPLSNSHHPHHHLHAAHVSSNPYPLPSHHHHHPQQQPPQTTATHHPPYAAGVGGGGGGGPTSASASASVSLSSSPASGGTSSGDYILGIPIDDHHGHTHGHHHHLHHHHQIPPPPPPATWRQPPSSQQQQSSLHLPMYAGDLQPPSSTSSSLSSSPTAAGGLPLHSKRHSIATIDPRLYPGYHPPPQPHHLHHHHHYQQQQQQQQPPHYPPLHPQQMPFQPPPANSLPLHRTPAGSTPGGPAPLDNSPYAAGFEPTGGQNQQPPYPGAFGWGTGGRGRGRGREEEGGGGAGSM
ncbi:hypothetical protein BDK51DRAFT_27255, partial [Blyttiomyces helicus]